MTWLVLAIALGAGPAAGPLGACERVWVPDPSERGMDGPHDDRQHPLGPASIACLEREIATSPDPATRIEASRVLLRDAWNLDHPLRWVPLAARHLDTLDPTDHQLAYELVLRSSTWAPERAPDVVHWTEVLLVAWSGPGADVRRLAFLCGVRTRAYGKVWKASLTSESPEVQAALREAMLQSVRDWYALAVLHDLDTAEAERICRHWLKDAPDDCPPPP